MYIYYIKYILLLYIYFKINRRLREVTGSYGRLREVTGSSHFRDSIDSRLRISLGYGRLREFTGGDRRLRKVTEGYGRLREVTGGYGFGRFIEILEILHSDSTDSS